MPEHQQHATQLMSILTRERASILTLTPSERVAAAEALAARMYDARLDTTGIDAYIARLTADRQTSGPR